MSPHATSSLAGHPTSLPHTEAADTEVLRQPTRGSGGIDADSVGPRAKATKSHPTSEISKGNPFNVPAWKKLLNENDPNSFTTASASPLLITHGGKDQEVPTVSSPRLLVTRDFCAERPCCDARVPDTLNCETLRASGDRTARWIG